MMAMFYVSTISLIALIVQYIDLSFPDELLNYGGSYDVIRTSSSALIVTFPVFLLTTWVIRKEFAKNPDEKNIAIRRWLIYLTLFIAGVTMVVDLIQFVNGFYSGELTLPFFLKLLTVLVFSLFTFAYFIWDLKEKGISSKQARILVVISSVFLFMTLAAGFLLAGSPAHQRAVRLDEQRVYDLQNIEYEIGNYWREKTALPENISDLERDLYYFVVPVDPETKEPYVYETTGELTFRLCANFSAESQTIPNVVTSQNQWTHAEGETCFERSIDPDFFNNDFGVIVKPN